MTATIARLVLAMLILPATGVVFAITLAVLLKPSRPPSVQELLVLWAIVYAFAGTYWVLLWRGVVRWTRSRVLRTAGASALALVAGAALAGFAFALNPRLPAQFLVLFGGGIVPIAWVVGTVVLWRETPHERADRLAALGGKVACPLCGYNLAGLAASPCPECGGRFTLDRLAAAQPATDARGNVVAGL